MKLSCELCPNEDTNKCNICQMDLGKEICMDIKELRFNTSYVKVLHRIVLQYIWVIL